MSNYRGHKPPKDHPWIKATKVCLNMPQSTRNHLPNNKGEGRGTKFDIDHYLDQVSFYEQIRRDLDTHDIIY